MGILCEIPAPGDAQKEGEELVLRQPFCPKVRPCGVSAGSFCTILGVSIRQRSCFVQASYKTNFSYFLITLYLYHSLPCLWKHLHFSLPLTSWVTASSNSVPPQNRGAPELQLSEQDLV